MKTHLDTGTGYEPIDAYGCIGNLRTAAMISRTGSIDMLCIPYFDSPTIFCKLLDKDKGGYFSIFSIGEAMNTRQQYLSGTNILSTKFLSDEGVADLTDFMHRPSRRTDPLYPCLVRRTRCVRGQVRLRIECFPAFDYARCRHTTNINCRNGEYEIMFHATDGSGLRLCIVIDCDPVSKSCPVIELEKVDRDKMLGPGVVSNVTLTEGQGVSFFLSQHPYVKDASFCTCRMADQAPATTTDDSFPTSALLDRLFSETQDYWVNWIRQATYTGRYREIVIRSVLALKLMTFELSGAVVAAPTFSLPEHIGGTRNWDYRYTWVRDASFTIYAFVRLGFTEEADAYMSFMGERLDNRNQDGGIDIMYRISGSSDLQEEELTHLDGYRGSKPVRIGNGAADHLQLDIYGELMDAVYLYNKYCRPISWKLWVSVRTICDYVVQNWKRPDNGIWEVRGQQQQFTYSKVLLWVALDRGLRLAEKRSLPCPKRAIWQCTKDDIYEFVMEKCYVEDLDCFVASEESRDILDASVLIMPLVFFIAPTEPRMLNTIARILKPVERGGLTSNGLVLRYNSATADDGVGGDEGSFTMTVFWLIEALARAGSWGDKELLKKAVTMFEDVCGYSNHLSLFSEEVARSGEALGNIPQAFSGIACISAAFNLDRALGGNKATV